MKRYILLLLLSVSPCLRVQLAAAEPAPGPGLGLTRVQVRPNLYMVVGGGANSLFLVTDAGVVLVGAKESEQAGSELRSVIAGVTRQPVRYLVEPSFHARYTHGSTIFPRAVGIVADERARQAMLAPPEANYWTGLAAPYLPEIAVSDRASLFLGSAQVELFHPGTGSTNGDLIVLFPAQHAAHMGDFFWNHRLPFIDRRHGGSATALVASLQRVLALPGIETFIPGYGDVGTRVDVQKQVALLRSLLAAVRRAVAQHRTRAQTIDAIPIPSYAASAGTEGFAALVGAIYDELAASPSSDRNRNLNRHRRTTD